MTGGGQCSAFDLASGSSHFQPKAVQTLITSSSIAGKNNLQCRGAVLTAGEDVLVRWSGSLSQLLSTFILTTTCTGLSFRICQLGTWLFKRMDGRTNLCHQWGMGTCLGSLAQTWKCWRTAGRARLAHSQASSLHACFWPQCVAVWAPLKPKSDKTPPGQHILFFHTAAG